MGVEIGGCGLIEHHGSSDPGEYLGLPFLVVDPTLGWSQILGLTYSHLPPKIPTSNIAVGPWGADMSGGI